MSINVIRRNRVLIISLLFILIIGCKKTPSYEIPKVGETLISNIGDTSAFASSVIIDAGSDAILARGFVWDNSGYPEINTGTIFNAGEGSGTFSATLDILEPSVHYYVRGYATNSIGTGYGSLFDFWTMGPPRVETKRVQEIIGEKATICGNFLFDGGEVVEEMGLCWGTDSLPSVDGTHIALEMAADSTFSITISELLPLTTYFVRSYAKSIKGLSYGNVIEFNTFGPTIVDIDGNTYETVNIGQKMWTASNLRVTKYNDGTPIVQVSDNDEWGTTTIPAWSYFDNNSDNASIYGLLYNWYAVKEKNICPEGWEVADDDDWKQLRSFLGANAAFSLKSFNPTYWISVDENTNTTNFSAVGNGNRDEQGKFVGLKRDAMWWTMTEVGSNGTGAWMWETSASSSGLVRSSYSKNRGSAIRCVKNPE